VATQTPGVIPVQERKLETSFPPVMALVPPACPKGASESHSVVPVTDVNQGSLLTNSSTTPKSPPPVQAQEVISKKPESSKSTERAATKRRASTKPYGIPQSKRQKTSQSVSENTRNDIVSEAIATGFQEIENHVFSLIKINEGVFELVPRIDLEYAAHVERFFPEAEPRMDSKLLMHILDTLEARGEVIRVMLSAVTSIGTRQYKSILVLPDIDPMTNPRIIRLQEELQQEAGSYKPALLNSQAPADPSASATVSTTIEIVQNLPKLARIPPFPIPAHSKQLPTSPKEKVRNLAKTAAIPFVPTTPPSKPAPKKESKKRNRRDAKLALTSPQQKKALPTSSGQHESMDEEDVYSGSEIDDNGLSRTLLYLNVFGR
jgi:hypothetical protein